MRKFHPQSPVLLLIEKNDQDFIWQAMNAGAYDLLVKPVGEGTLLLGVHRAIEACRLRIRVKRGEETLVTTVGGLLRDLEVLYGAYGLQSNFEAFMAWSNAERQASRGQD